MRRSEYIGTTEPQNEIDWKPPTRRDDETSSIELTLSVDFSMKSRSTDCAVLFLYYTPTSVEVNTVKPSYWRLFNCCGYFSVIFFFLPFISVANEIRQFLLAFSRLVVSGHSKNCLKPNRFLVSMCEKKTYYHRLLSRCVVF